MSNDTTKGTGGLERAIYFIAALAGIAGVAFWIWEAPDREEERDARRSELVARANQILKDAGATGSISSADDPTVAWAIQTLVKYQHPVVLTADRVTLAQINAECAAFVLDARSLSIIGGRISNSQIEWTGDAFTAVQLETAGVSFAAHTSNSKADISMANLSDTSFVYGDFMSPTTAFEIEFRSTKAHEVWIAPDLRFAINMGLESPSGPSELPICRLKDGKLEGPHGLSTICPIEAEEQARYKHRVIEGWIQKCDPPFIVGSRVPQRLADEGPNPRGAETESPRADSADSSISPE